ncbi:MAG: RdgB/HAM1 family non-canonical purine NTP pyrophosphatase [Anaerolineales bacterium]
MKRDLLIATTNPGKLREYRSLLARVPACLCSLDQLGLSLEVPEDGESYEENATKKALAFASVSGLLTLADDTGLEVDLLGGEPGIRSARYAGPNADDPGRRGYLLEQLRRYPQPWIARFQCVIALVEPGRDPAIARGTCWGEIVPVPRGTSGFGYDPIFQVRGEDRTFAQLSLEQKNRISHRAQAFHALLPALGAFLHGGAGTSA